MPSQYDLSKLTEEEKEQLKDYVNAIKETKNAAKELLDKAKSPKNEDWGGARKDMVMSMSENGKVTVPENILKFAKKKGATSKVMTMAKWLSEIGKKIVGGTAIGKDYDTLVLDVTHQGSEIYYNTETGKVEVNGKAIRFNKEAFLQAIQ